MSRSTSRASAAAAATRSWARARPPKMRPRAGLWLGRGKALVHGELGQAGDAVDLELVHDLGAVGLDGLDAHVQPRGDLLGGLALGHELEHLALAGRE